MIFMGTLCPNLWKCSKKMLEKQKQWSYSLMTMLQCALPVWRIKTNKRILYSVKKNKTIKQVCVEKN